MVFLYLINLHRSESSEAHMQCNADYINTFFFNLFKQLLCKMQSAESILYHPLVIYAVILTAFFYMSQTFRFLTHGRVKGMHLKYFYLYIALFLIVANFIIKNIILITKHVYIMP